MSLSTNTSPTPDVDIYTPSPRPDSTTFVSPATIRTPASNEAFDIDSAISSKTESSIPASIIKDAVIYKGSAPTLANEGKLVVFVPERYADGVLSVMRAHVYGHEAAVIGRVVKSAGKGNGRVEMVTSIGTSRVVAMPDGRQLPRIC